MRSLRVASCQFPVSGDVEANARYIRRYMKRAAEAGAHLLHTSEAPTQSTLLLSQVVARSLWQLSPPGQRQGRKILRSWP